MTEKPSDDIFALCSRFDLDQESYRVFPKKLPTVRPSEFSEIPAAPTEAEPEHSVSPTAQASRTALRNLWHHVEMSEARSNSGSFDELLAASVFVYGTAGGTGATTVCATLARLFAQGGKSCALVDDRPESVLPFFFGGQQSLPDGKRYRGLYAASGTPIRMITRQTSETGSLEDKNEGENDWFQRSIASFQDHLDHLVVDVQRGQEPSLLTGSAPIALLVAVPDISSLMGARALKRILSAGTHGSQVICVLNKFDSSLALHAEIHGWFEENFSRVLTLGRSDLFNEALAESLTVVDWMPQSEAAADFSLLLNTIQSMMPSRSHSQPKGGVSLCS
jgi:MinD-like ATPase involved in chromosome partitioning or flagellar assembly